MYKDFLKPLFFKFDAEMVHDVITATGEFLEDFPGVNLLSYKNKKLEKTFAGIKFPNPIGLAAGFDYDGHLAAVLKRVGYGFNTVGTVTAKPYGGNLKPRLGRLPNSKSLFVNKGFKNEGVEKVVERLEQKDLDNTVLGISVGASNLPEVNTINKAIDDYLFTFSFLKSKNYIKYFELNISCPNTAMPENFTIPKNFELLVKAIKPDKPTFVKMPNEISPQNLDPLLKLSLKYGLSGFILSNLVKDRTNKYLLKDELKKFEGLKGNFSGKPCFDNSNKLIAYVAGKYGKDCVIIGCGGVFTADDAMEKLNRGADLVQMVTGLIFEGPAVIGQINRDLVRRFGGDN